MLIPALRPIAISILLFNSAAAISQSAGYANRPYTATKKNTTIQKLADGTTITHESTSTEARDSQGRTMQQNSLTGMPGHNITHTNVMDPVARTNTTWMSQGKQATRFHMPDLHGAAQQSGPMAAGPSSSVIAVASSSSSFSQTIQSGGTAAAPEMTGMVTMIGGPVGDPKLRPERKTEKLGGKTIAGVYAEGTRVMVTYPVGFFGNDKPIITIHETWLASDLKLIVLSVDDDPRSGTRIAEVTDLDRGEPNPALFQVPDGYTIKDQFPISN
jgi:hypothetical protein